MTEQRVVLKRTKTGEELDLSGVVHIGREVDNGIKLLEKGASRHHATLTVVDGTAYIEDEGSRNGTSLNDRRLMAKTVLKSGDRIKFDTEEFEFRVYVADPTVVRPVVDQPASPGSWAEVEFNEKGSDGTERFDANQLKEYLAKVKERQESQTRLDIKEPCLRVFSGGVADRLIPLTTNDAPTQQWTIGRSPDSAIHLEEGDVSERHAKLVREGGQWKLVDALSSNGTYVNGLRIGMCYLTGGDTLGLGTRVQCVFNLPSRGLGRSLRIKKWGLTRVFLIGLAVSFFVTLMILYWLFWT
jgi:pSer/pThr/pTyr-binding forkhead associated (FHA) protein